MSWFLLAGCASDPKHAYTSVLEGMSRNNLRYYFGEPLRIEPATSGGENWYYRFSSLRSKPVGASGKSEDFGEQTSYVSVGLEFSKQVEELPVHVSVEGFVVPPVPKGKVLKN
jgi:hypothetical protein